MEVRSLMELVSGEVNFKILRTLHDKPMFASDLESRLNVNVRTIRVHLHRLRKRNVVEYKKEGRKHLYRIKTPFESLAHEVLMTLIALADPIKKRGENDRPLQVEDHATNRLRNAQGDYWTTLIGGIVENFLRHGSPTHSKELHKKLRQLEQRIQQLKEER